MRSVITFAMLLLIKLVSKVFYRHRVEWISEIPNDAWRRLRLVSVLNHTSLYEPLLVGAAPNPLLWKIARWGVLPIAAKTMRRKVGLFFRMIARNVVVITRKNDHTWQAVLDHIDDRAVVCILPEGRMMRRNGLDEQGQPMTVRGGIADILQVVEKGYMLIVYSGGLHHIQAPGELLPRLFKTIRVRLELVDIASYLESLEERTNNDGFKRAVIDDLQDRRDSRCPTEVPLAELHRRGAA